jgi:hypothetical protein
MIDQGVLEIHRNTTLVAQETFQIERTPGRGLAVTIRSTVRYDDSRAELTALIELDTAGYPFAAQFDHSGPPPERAMVTLDARAVTYRILTQTGNNWEGNFRRPAGLVFWNEKLFAPYLVAPAITPGTRGIDLSGRQVRHVELIDGGTATETLGSKPTQARFVTLTSEGDRILLWYVDDRLMKVEIPAQAVSAVRRSSEP